MNGPVLGTGGGSVNKIFLEISVRVREPKQKLIKHTCQKIDSDVGQSEGSRRAG